MEEGGVENGKGPKLTLGKKSQDSFFFFLYVYVISKLSKRSGSDGLN